MIFTRTIKDSYFPSDIDSFAILLKGSSLSNISKYHQEFENCFIVSDYDDELAEIGKYIEGKQISHFVNRLINSSLSKANYIKYGIKNIQIGYPFLLDRHLLRAYVNYKMMVAGLRVHLLPRKLLLLLNKNFPKEYKYKFPNTGILSIIYSLEIIRPKKLWIFGLDLYSAPYMTKQTQPAKISIEGQHDKIERLNMSTFLLEIFLRYPNTKIMMFSHYPKWGSIENLTVMP